MLTGLMSSLLLGVNARDLITFGVVPLIFALVAITAALIPAWRAIRVDPMVALRAE
jgi:putative ABC transport system permease protein